MFRTSRTIFWGSVVALTMLLTLAAPRQASAQLYTLADMTTYFAPCTDTRVAGFYFADASTNNGRSAFLRVSNRASYTVQLQLYALHRDGSCERVYPPYDHVSGDSVLEIPLHEVKGLQNREFSLKLAIPTGSDHQHISVVKSSYTAGLKEGTMVQGVEFLTNQVHLAEGAFDETITVFNPTDRPVQLLFEFMDQTGNVYTRFRDIPTGPGRRKFNVTQEFFVGKSFPHSTKILAFYDWQYDATGGPVIVAEREVTTPNQGAIHSENAVQPSMTWNGAEGSKGGMFHTYLLLSNPNYTPTDVIVFFFHENGQTYSIEKSLLPMSRLTVDVKSEQSVPDGNFAYRVYVWEGNPIVVERAVYWGLKNGAWQGAHVAAGAPEYSTRWHFAEGNTNRPFHTFLLIDAKAPETHVTLTFRTLDGEVIHHSMVLNRRGRWTFNLAELVPAEAFSVEVNSDWNIMAEMAMYWTTEVDGETRMGGSVTPGRPTCVQAYIGQGGCY